MKLQDIIDAPAKKGSDNLHNMYSALLRTDDILIRKEAAAVILELVKETQ